MKLMAILNVTPDSFSDGQPLATLDDFEHKAMQLIEEGADILDIGGESTRPNAQPVSETEEMHRVLPLINRIRQRFPKIPISLDTKKYAVAKAALSFDIQMINDVSFLHDPRLAELAMQNHCDYVLMHSRGDSQTMMNLTEYPNGLVPVMKREIEEKFATLRAMNFPFDQLILDLGFGFAKTPEQCVELVRSLSQWQHFHQPLMFAVSRKRFLQKYTSENLPRERDEISAELATQAIALGFSIIRTHNISLTKQKLKT